MRPSRLVAALCALLVVGATSKAIATSHAAQPSVLTLLTESAQGEFDAGHYARAALEFDAAYRLEPSGPLLWSAARAYHLAGEAHQARERYYDCVGADDLSPRQRSDASLALIDIELQFKTSDTPPRARVFNPNVGRPPPALANEQSTQSQDVTSTAALQAPQTRAYAQQYTRRPLTLPGGSWSLSGGMGVGRSSDSDETSLGLTAAVSYGIVDAFELGAFVMQLQLLERVVYDRPALYALAQLFTGPHYTFGAKIEVVAGVQSYSAWSLTVGMPQHYLPFDWMRLELGVYVEFVMSRVRLINLHIPAVFQFQLNDTVFSTVSTSLVFVNGDHLVMPLGAGIGYTFTHGEQPVCDLLAQLQWPLLYQPENDGRTDFETLTAELSARCYL
jgi:hypothetical protein